METTKKTMAVAEAKATTSLKCGNSGTAATEKVAKMSATAAKANDDDDDRGGSKSDGDGDGDGNGNGSDGGCGGGGGGVASAAAMTTTAMSTATTIALLATIQSTGAAVVLLLHGAEPPWPCRCPVVKRHPRTRRAKAGDFPTYAPLSSVKDVTTERDI